MFGAVNVGKKITNDTVLMFFATRIFWGHGRIIFTTNKRNVLQCATGVQNVEKTNFSPTKLLLFVLAKADHVISVSMFDRWSPLFFFGNGSRRPELRTEQ
jgi:hypothetical protein